jgi:hypothetical protein
MCKYDATKRVADVSSIEIAQRRALRCMLTLLLGSVVFHPTAARADHSGTVFVDANANGWLDAGEVGRADVVVSNGRDVVRTDADGRYRLPEHGRFVFITRPHGFGCANWHAESGGDFALVATAASTEFFFIQISDAHVYDRKSDFQDFSSRPVPWWMPQFAVDWLTLSVLERVYGDDVTERFRAAVEPYVDTSDLEGVAAYQAYVAEFGREGSELGDVVAHTRAAFREVAGLRPEFILNTGDLVLESNQGSPDAIERWFRFYMDVSSGPIPRYDTIGNNEIAGSDNQDFGPDDSRYGKHFFRSFLGPTYYSFDRGPFHFVALDTHRRASAESEDWDFNRMEPDVASWLAADLAAHVDRVLVVANHEPFHFDPAWPFEADPSQTVDDEGLLAKHGVSWTLTGHTHFKSFLPGDITHITTGALSGLRWVLPPSVHPRGYRLLYARDRKLFTAWKPSGEPVLAVSEGSLLSDRVVLVIADRDGPFQSIEVSRDGESLAVERWGDYFASVAASGSGGALEVRASRADGSVEVARLSD